MTWSPSPEMLVASAPAWSAATSEESVGVDYLGTRAANLEMLGSLTGTYNNLIVSARQHAILCWAAWRFFENCRRARDEGKPHNPTSEQFNEFVEAVETIQLVGQVRAARESGSGVVGLGSGSAVRLGSGPDVPLRFHAYGRTRETSAMAAVQYGPSAKSTGLGLLTGDQGVWVPTERGRALALAIDDELKAAEGYELFTQMEVPERVTLSVAEELAEKGLSLRAASAQRPELPAYRTALFRLDSEPSFDGDRRPLSVTLFLELVRSLAPEGEGVTSHLVRQALLHGVADLPNCLQSTARRWQLFQLRQIQRFALEAWLGVLELSMLLEGSFDPKTFSAWLVSALSGNDGAPCSSDALERPAAEVLVGTSSEVLSIDGAWDLAEKVDALLRAGDPAGAAVIALRFTIGALRLIRELVPGEGPLREFATIGGRLRIGLPAFANWWTDRERFSLGSVLTEMALEFVLQQHVAVAMSRLTNEKRRLRFCNDEGGWSLLPGTSPTRPTMTPDRIRALMALLADIGLLEEANTGYRISAAGDALRLDALDKWAESRE